MWKDNRETQKELKKIKPIEISREMRFDIKNRWSKQPGETINEYNNRVNGYVEDMIRSYLRYDMSREMDAADDILIALTGKYMAEYLS